MKIIFFITFGMLWTELTEAAYAAAELTMLNEVSKQAGDTSTFDDIRKWLEIGYFISQIIIMILVALGLNQIQLMKKQIKDQKNANQINAKRDALKITSEQITKYGTEIIPLINALDEKIKSEKIEFFKKSKVKITNDQIEVSLCKETKEVEKMVLIMSEFITAMNAIEGFSIYFTSGVADESIAYRSLSTTFCGTIKDLLPIIVPSTNNENRFNATLTLFSVWNSRIESKTLSKQKEELEQKIKNSKPQVIKIVGFNADSEN